MNAVMISLLAITFMLFVLPTQVQSAPMALKIDAPRDMLDPKKLFCAIKGIDAAFKGPDDKQYYFDVYQVFVVSPQKKVEVIPRKKLFPNSPYFVNAMSFSQVTGKAYLFKDRKVWIYKYRGNEFTFLKTKLLNRMTPNILEAAFFYQGFIYLLKDGFLYTWDEESNDVIPNHVFPIDYFWKGVPSDIKAAMQYENSNRMVFWKQQRNNRLQYYIFDNVSNKPKKGSFTSFFPFCGLTGRK